MKRSSRLGILTLIVGLVSFVAFTLPTVDSRAAPLTPGQIVQRAWQRAQQAGAYHFSSRVVQTTHLAPSLANVGRPSRKETVYLQGEANLPERELLMSLWQGEGSVLDPRDGVEVRVENDRVYGRPLNEMDAGWQEIDSDASAFSGAFAPGGDLVAYLAGAKNVRLVGEDTRPIPDYGDTQYAIRNTQYSFTFDGPAFADHLRAQLEAHLRQSGQLPPGVHLDTPDQLRDAIGEGEVWIDGDGLPLRLVTHLEYPQQASGERVEVEVKTDFSNFDRQQLAAATHPAARLAGALGLPRTAHDWQQAAWQASLLACCVGLAVLLITHRNSKKLYAAFVLVISLSMVVTPLLQSYQVAAFFDKQAAQRSKQEQHQAEQDATRDYWQEITGSDWDPHQDPLATANDQRPIMIPEAERSGTTNDPLRFASRAGEQVVQSSLSLSDVSISSDDDEDSLSAIQERRLGTDPDEPDTDGDQITDTLEVQGFWYNNKRWYLDPLQPDTNNDGQIDTVECPQLVQGTGQVCQDTDEDGTPDFFDRDNDGDGVPDWVDLSPFSAVYRNQDQAPFNADYPLLLQVDDLEEDEPAFVDFQLRTADEEHLWYALNVLDWPSGDEMGQIQRREGNDSTFEDIVESGQSAPANASNGDMRLIPMLEIEIPYQGGHYGNLPVKDGAPPTRTKDMTVGVWVDTSKLDPYGISVRDLNGDGDLVAYVPLNLVEDETGQDRVAFKGRMHYWPGTADWGSTQKVRVAWLVQMLTDTCTDKPCDKDENWDLDQVKIVHSYRDEWYLTGLAVREDHGLEVAIAYEDPAEELTDEDRQYDDHLWALAWGLDATFLAGRDCEPTDDNGECVGDGERDITIAEIERRFDNRSNTGTTDEERWDIPITATQVATFSYEHGGYIVEVMITETQDILSRTFSAYVDQGSDAPTLLFAQEAHYRTTNLDNDDTASQDGRLLSIRIDPEAVEEETHVAMSWAPYRYEDDDWESYPIEEYWDKMGVRFEEVFDEYKDDERYEEIRANQVMFAQWFYLALFQGRSTMVQMGPEIFEQGAPQTNAELAEWMETVSAGGGGVARVTKALAGTFTNLITQAGKVYTDVTFRRLPDLKIQISYKKLRGFNRSDLKVAGMALLTFTMIALSFVAQRYGLKVLAYTLSAVTLAFSAHAAVQLAVTIFKAARGSFEAITKLSEAGGVSGASVVGLIIALVVTWALFAWMVAEAGIKFGSLAFNYAFATTVASTITAVILLAIAAIPVIGQVIAAVVALFDSLVLFICGLMESDNPVCKGISGWITEGVRWFIYSASVMVTISDEDRIELKSFEQDFVDPAQGATPGAGLTVSTTVRNSLSLISWKDTHYDWKAGMYWWQYSPETLSSSNFRYHVQSQARDHHEGLKRGMIGDDEWDPEGCEDASSCSHEQKASGDTQLPSPGINRQLALYLTESYAAPVQECWAIPILFPPLCLWPCLPICYVRTEKASTHNYLGKNLRFDVFPRTLAEFYALADKKGGYALAWSQDSDPSFPRLQDADGDGLRNKVDGGSDPNDARWDSDGDRLSDYHEARIGSDPQKFDSDQDGLGDYDEVVLGTDPLRVDSDYDGLTDKEEVDGWEFAYDLDERGQQLVTWVNSDPLSIDGDGDELTDFQEKTFGFHPRVESDPHVLSFESEVSEAGAPQLLLRFAETEGASTFRDDSGYNHNASCELCPVSGHRGSYDNALYFDGQDDYLAAGQIDFARADYSLAAWFKTGASTTQDILAAVNPNGDQHGLLLEVRDNGQVRYLHRFPSGSSGGTNIYSGGAYNDDAWHHVTAVKSGSDLALYVDGAPVGAASDSSAPSYALDVTIGRLRTTESARHFNGRMDEIALFSRALSRGEIEELAAGRYNPNDLVVRPGDKLDYEARVKNELFNRYAQGLLSTDFPGGFSQDVPPEDFVLNPQEEQVMAGQVQVSQAASSGTYSLTQVAGAQITDWREASDYAELWLRFDEWEEEGDVITFTESSGWQPPREGTCQGSTCPETGVDGRFGSAVQFDGTDDYVAADDVVESLAVDALSFGAWVYPTASSSNQVAVLSFNTASGGNRNILFYRLDNNKFAYYDGSAKWQYSRDTFDLNQWYHVMVVIEEDDDGVLYVNGVDQARFKTGVRPAVDGRFSVGQEWDGGNPSDFFQGRIDEVVILNRALSARQVQERYHQPVLDIAFDEGTGASQFQDDSGFDNKATCPGAHCPTSGQPGVANEAVQFNGREYVSTAEDASLDLSDGDFTLSAWVYPQGDPPLSACPFVEEYFDNRNLAGTPEHRKCVNWPIDYNWGDEGPSGQWENYFSMRWTGTFEFAEGDHTFTAVTDDGMRVWLDDARIIDEWRDQGATTYQATRHVSAGLHTVKVEYYEKSGSARAKLSWSPAPLPHAQGILGKNSGDAYAGRCSGGHCPAAISSGKYGYARSFDGQDDYIAVDEVVKRLSGDALSFGAWVYLSPDLAENDMILAFNTADNGNYGMLQYSGDRNQFLYYDPQTGDRFSTDTFDRAQWHHVFVVVDSNNNGKLYVNGNEQASFSSGVRPAFDGKFSVGQEWDSGGTSQHLLGRVDEVLVYGRALSAAEVADLYNGRPAWGAVLHLPFDETTNTDEFVDAAYYEASYPTIQRVGNRLRIGVSTWNERVEYTTPDDVLAPEAWNHVVATFDTTAYKLYVNGDYVGEAAAPGKTPAPGQSLDMGRSTDLSRLELDKLNVVALGDPDQDGNRRGGEYIVQFKEGNGDWQQIWHGEDLYQDDYVDMDWVKSFQEQTALRVYEQDSGEYESCFMTRCDDDPDDDPMGDYSLGAMGSSTYEYAHTFKNDKHYQYYDEVDLLWYQETDAAPFEGRLDELAIYKRALSAQEVQDLYDAATIVLHLRLDDPPGVTDFQDATGQNNGSCSGSACPTAGITGRVQQGLRFDGEDDWVKVNGANDDDLQELTLGTWVKLNSTPARNMRFITLSSEKAVLRQGSTPGQLHFYMKIGGSLRHIRVNNALEVDRWYYVAGTYDGGTMRLYLDGQQVGQLAIAGTVGGGSGLSLSSAGETLDGYLDEVMVFRRALDADEIQSLYQAAPSFILHLDEAEGATLFEDGSGSGHHATCSGGGCPTAGVKGQIGLAANLDGVNDTLAASGVDSGDELTLMAWVRPESLPDDRVMRFVTLGDEKAVLRYDGVQGPGQAHFYVKTDQGFYNIRVNNALQPGFWYHVAGTYDGAEMRLYLNGNLAADPLAVQGALVGGSTLRLSSASETMDGRIDEVTLYNQALSPHEVRDIYRYQAKWVEERQSSKVTVDAEAPWSRLEFFKSYHPNQDIMLQVSAGDATSLVKLVELGVSTDDGASYTWLYAPPCQQAEAAWCPTFDPADFGGEGRYTLQVRATDAVGNRETPTQAHTLLVDDTPSGAGTTMQPGAILGVSQHPELETAWLVSLQGDVHDPLLSSGDAGSGPADVRVKLTGQSMFTATLPQSATVNANTWGIDYVLDKFQPTDVYTLSAQAADQVDNTTPFLDLVTIGVDATPPEASLDDVGSSVTGSITTPLLLTGRVTESGVVSAGVSGVQVGFLPAAQTSVSGTAVLLHLDERAGATHFVDASGYGQSAACQPGYCPEAGVAGQWGYALNFDQDHVKVESVGERLASGALSFGAWVYPEDDGEILTFDDPGIYLHLDWRGYFAFSVGRLDAESERVDMNRWYHVMAVIQEDGAGSLYLDGVQQATFQTDVRPNSKSNLWVGGMYNSMRGRIDEVVVYDQALAASEVMAVYANATVAPAGEGVIASTWSYTVPAGLDGFYQINLRGVDTRGNYGEPSTWDTGWDGEIDTRAPLVNIEAEILGVNQWSWETPFTIRTQYTCWAQDFNLYERRSPADTTPPTYDLLCPCFEDAPGSTSFERIYYHEVSPWYRETFSDTTRLHEIRASCVISGAWFITATMRACDVHGHCAVAETLPEVPFRARASEGDARMPGMESAPTDHLVTSSPVQPATSSPANLLLAPTFDSVVLSPAPGTVLTETAPISVTGGAYALSSLKAVTFTVDSGAEQAFTWPRGLVTGTYWTVSWTPPAEDVYILSSVAEDWLGRVQTDTHPVTVSVDTVSPTVGITPILTTEHQISLLQAGLTGWVSDTIGVNMVQVKVEDSPWGLAFVQGNTWYIPWYLGGQTAGEASRLEGLIPEGESLTVSVRAYDAGGHSTWVTDIVTVDLVSPTPVTLSVAHAGQLVKPGTILREVSPTLVLTWTASTDGYGLDDYQAGWTIETHRSTDISQTVGMSGTRAITHTFPEGARVTAWVTCRDGYGNRRHLTYGPFYVDSDLTADYVAFGSTMAERAGVYTGWMQSECSLIGVDRRVKDNAAAGASLDAEQKLYASWNEEALRLSWTGANWNVHGDLFVYFDPSSAPGGTSVAFNPYTSTPSTTVRLPGTISGTNAMAADYLVWVQDENTASLLSWNGSVWISDTQLTAEQYAFDAGLNDGQADLYLPFSMIGISLPQTSRLTMLAFATEEDAMRLWATMPDDNPVNSDLVVESGDFAGEDRSLALVHAYEWTGLGDGMCPNGKTGFTFHVSHFTSPSTSRASQSLLPTSYFLLPTSQSPTVIIANPLPGAQLDTCVANLAGTVVNVVAPATAEVEVTAGSLSSTYSLDLTQVSPFPLSYAFNQNIPIFSGSNTLLVRATDATGTGSASVSVACTAAAPAVNGYPDTDLELSVSAEPLGVSYSFLGDDLFWLWEELFAPDRLPGLSQGFDFTDVTHPPLGDRQEVRYTVHYRNRGTEIATGLGLDISSHYALRLPAGEHLPLELRDHQLVSLGDVGPGERGTATFYGLVDLEATRQEYYQPCLQSLPPGAPVEGCEVYLHWASLTALVYDDAHPLDGAAISTGTPLDWIWVDHRVDSDPPAFFGLLQPEYLVAPMTNTLRGYAYDALGVPTLTLAITAPSGLAGVVTCPDAVPGDGQWSCAWDAAAANGGVPPADGETFAVRLRAADSAGQASAWLDWGTWLVDAVPPTVTLDAATTLAYSHTVVNEGKLVLSGQVDDNQGVGAVELCLGEPGGMKEECALVDAQAKGMTAQVYDDEPLIPEVLDASTTCGTGEIVRTWWVTDSFVLGEVSLGFNATHASRGELRATLQSPAGTRVQVLGREYGVVQSYQDYDVLLSDAAASSLPARRGDDDPAAPYYERSARPYQPLHAFRGEDSAGEWTLAICDENPLANSGAYNRARLALTPHGEQGLTPSGYWFQTRAVLDELDDVEQVLSVYGLDLVGNRSTAPLTLAFRIDNVPPVLTVTSAISQALAGPDQAAVTVLDGQASDGGQVRTVYAFVRTPAGKLRTVQVGRAGAGAWWVKLRPDEAGPYTLWVNALDDAGNVTTAGPHMLEVSAPPYLLKQVQPGADVPLGSVVSYTLALYNDNPDPISSVVITDPLPAGLYSPTLHAGSAFVLAPGGTLRWGPFAVEGHSVVSVSFTALVTDNTAYYGAFISNTAYYTAAGFAPGASDVTGLQVESAPPGPAISIASPWDGQVVTATNPISASVPITVDTRHFVLPYDGYWQLWDNGAVALEQVLTYTVDAGLVVGQHILSATLHATDTQQVAASIPVSVTVVAEGGVHCIYLPLVVKQS